jgi:signal peptidase I
VLQAIAISAIYPLVLQPIATVALQRAPAITLVAAFVLGLAFITAVAAHAARISRQPAARFHTRARVVSVCIAFIVVFGALSTFVEETQHRYLGETFRIPSGAMFPTLLIGDHFSSAPYRQADPERGDVAVFRVARDGSDVYPADIRPDLATEIFVKRIIGLPGEEIDFRNAKFYVNGEVIEAEPLNEVFEDPKGMLLDVSVVSLGQRTFRTLDDPYNPGPRRTTDGAIISWPIRVEEGRYFMLGDNRDHSKDSRVWGTVHRDDMVGKVTTIYWSWDFNGSWLEVLNPMTWFTVEKRWDRIGKSP